MICPSDERGTGSQNGRRAIIDVLKINNLFARRSIQAFTAGPVTPTQVGALMEAAMAAPSAANRKPWHFAVVTDAEVRARLAEVRHAQMVRQSPLALVPCGESALGCRTGWSTGSRTSRRPA